MAERNMGGSSARPARRDPYDVLCVSRDSPDQEIKVAYRKLALKCVASLFHSVCIICLSIYSLCLRGMSFEVKNRAFCSSSLMDTV